MPIRWSCRSRGRTGKEAEADQKAHQDQMDAMTRMKKLKGAEFDREFVNQMVMGHERVISRIDTAMGIVKNLLDSIELPAWLMSHPA